MSEASSIILCGPPYTGKTTLGQQAAAKLRWTFIDTDRLLEKYYGVEITCREIYRMEGEEQFRRLESQAIATLKGSHKCVIALGGGTFNLPENARFLKTLGSLYYLKTPFDILLKRLLAAPLPSYLENEIDPVQAFRRLVEARSKVYEMHADKVIDTDQFLLKILQTATFA
jgi:shikimate kinase